MKKIKTGKKMADNSEPAPSKKKILCEIQRIIQKSQTGEGFALCTVCRSDFSVAYGGENDINRHKYTSKHKGYVDTAQ